MMQRESHERYFAGEAAEMADNDMKRLEPEGVPPVALYRIDGAFYATDDTCTHGQVSLTEGELEADGVVFCPFHGGSFDVRTGEALSPPCVVPLNSYPVMVEEGRLYVDLRSRVKG
jgi:nitrite reductase/ring-hydroxylating ferredoxin subunit